MQMVSIYRNKEFKTKNELLDFFTDDEYVVAKQPVVKEGECSVLELSEKTKHSYNSTSELSWHQDNTYDPNPYQMTALYAVDVENSGDTHWVSTKDLYDCLHEYHDIMDGATALHTLRNYKETVEETLELDSRIQNIAFARKKARHPLVTAGYLFYNPAYVESIQDKDGNDISYMKGVIDWRLKNMVPYSHKWEKGDLVVFNNIRTIHRRDKTNGPRTLWRVCFE